MSPFGFCKANTRCRSASGISPSLTPFVVVSLSRLCFVITMADAQWQTGPKELDPAALGLAIRKRRKVAKKSFFKMEGREYLPLVYWVVGTAVAIV